MTDSAAPPTWMSPQIVGSAACASWWEARSTTRNAAWSSSWLSTPSGWRRAAAPSRRAAGAPAAGRVPTMPQLSVGDAFPELTVDSAEGPVELSGRWRDGALVVAFMRHFG